MGKSLEKLSFNPQFFGQKCKNMLFWRKTMMVLSEVLYQILRGKYLSNNTGTTHYDSLQGSYWADQKDSHN